MKFTTRVAAAMLVACTSIVSAPASAQNATDKKKYEAAPPMTIDPAKTYTATIDTSMGTIVTELLPKLAPNHVNSFVFLAGEKYYDGVVFHRVIRDFMIQGGDPTGTGRGGPGYTLDAEFSNQKHVPGVLSMARTNDPNSAGSQFFIVHGNAEALDGKYTVFGKVTKGMDVVNKIAETPVDSSDRPLEPVVIKSITITQK